MKTNKTILIGGSRTLTASHPAWVACQSFTQSIIFDTPHSINTGCATGADQAVILASPSGASVQVFATFSQSGAGSFSGSAVATVQSFASDGGLVHWLAGGSLQVPLIARLMSRSLAALAGCSSAVFFAPGVGSLKVARAALKAGIPVFVSCAGLSSAPVLPVPCRVISWQGFEFWQYTPATQSALF